jgi:heptosyltransferase II
MAESRRLHHDPAAPGRPTGRLLVVMPTWLGDIVMATPALRALRQVYPDAHITALVRRSMRPILEPCPWADRCVSMRARGGLLPRTSTGDGERRESTLRLAARLARGRFDTAVLLPNSFRTALLARLAGIPRRIGYDRDARGGLLTDRLLPRRRLGGFVPVPAIDYYLGLARYLGAANPDATMQLFTRPVDDAKADALLTEAGYRVGDPRPLVLLNPGANYGDAKMWYPDRFAAVADKLAERFDAVTAINGSPRERPILAAVHAAAQRPIIDLARRGFDLRLLKSVVRRCSLMITNDTGPRHVAAAMGVPVVSIFGPTDPRWAETGFVLDRQVRIDVFCSPCQKKRCPIDHRCMTGIDADMVFEHAADLLGRGRAGVAGDRSIPAARERS